MFGQEAAACCNGSGSGSKTAVLRLPATPTRVIAGREVPFPMVSPFSPVARAGAPVTGLTAFPMQRPLGKRYYGLGKLGWPELSTVPGWSLPTTPNTTINGQGVSLPGSPSTLQTILNSINAGLATIPAIISANRSQPYYNPSQIAGQPAQTLYGQPLAGSAALPGSAGASIGSQAGAAVGNIGDTIGQIVAQHPYLVLGGGLAVVLLMMKPPSRR